MSHVLVRRAEILGRRLRKPKKLPRSARGMRGGQQPTIRGGRRTLAAGARLARALGMGRRG